MNPLRRVLIIQRRLPHYRVALFERLRARLSEEQIELSVAYGSPAPWEKVRADQGKLTWGTALQSRYFSPIPSRSVWLGVPWSKVAQQELIIFPHEGAILDNHVLLALRGRLHAKLALWGHGRNFQHRSFIRDLLKRWMLRGVDHYFAYTELSARVLAEQGMPPERVTVVQNAIDTTRLIAWRATVIPAEREQQLHNLELKGECSGLFLGSLTLEKYIPFLLDAAVLLRKRFPEFELLVVGDGPLRNLVLEFVAKHPWAHWVGSALDREKVVLGSLCQIMLNPGMVGLNILDAFAMGLPMVTTDCGIHSPEIAYLEHGRNGLLMPCSLEAFVEGVTSLLVDSLHRQTMVAACLEDAARYTLDDMVDRFAKGILAVLESPFPDRGHSPLTASGIVKTH